MSTTKIPLALTPEEKDILSKIKIPSEAAGLALLLQMADSMPKDKKIVIVNTGKLKLKR
jgi:hypothetical protein